MKRQLTAIALFAAIFVLCTNLTACTTPEQDCNAIVEGYCKKSAQCKFYDKANQLDYESQCLRALRPDFACSDMTSSQEDYMTRAAMDGCIDYGACSCSADGKINCGTCGHRLADAMESLYQN